MGLPETVEQRLDLMVDQIERAARHRHPMLLIAVYRFEFTRADMEQGLQERLGGRGYWAIPLEVTGPDDADLAARLAHHPAADDPQAVFFCRGLGRGFPATLRSLNLRRELLAERRLKVVFWVTEREAARLTREAPDFWAFRGRVVEFLEVPPLVERVRVASELAWAGFEDAELRRLSSEERRARIALRERLLAELPEDEASRAARASLHYTLGWLYHRNGQLGRAEQHHRVALELASQDGSIHLQASAVNGLGNVYYALGRYEQANVAYRKAVGLDPKFAYPWNGLGKVYRALGRYKEAVEAYKKAIELKPELANFWNGLGNVYIDLGYYQQAIAAYQKAIKLDPNLGACWNRLGYVYRDLGRQQEAIEAFQKAIELGLKDAGLYTMLGALYELEGRLEEALREHQRAVKLQPEHGAFHIALASVLCKLGHKSDAAEHLARARELLPPGNHYNWACLEAIAGNADAALEHLKKALEQAPGQRLWARRDPDLAALHDTPRFWELVGQPRQIHPEEGT